MRGNPNRVFRREISTKNGSPKYILYHRPRRRSCRHLSLMSIKNINFFQVKESANFYFFNSNTVLRNQFVNSSLENAHPKLEHYS